MSEFTIRDYQQLCHAATLAARQRGFRSSLASIFTGGGKTETFIYLLKQTLDLRHERGLVMAPAHLVGQTYARMMNRVPVWGDKVKADGYDMVKAVGVEMADREDPNARIVVGSIPTVTDRVPTDTEPLTMDDLEVEKVGDNYRVRKSSRSKRRVLVSERMDGIIANGLFHTIIWDEAHHAVSKGGNLLRNRLCPHADEHKTRTSCHDTGHCGPDGEGADRLQH
jgi:superfamily II DNA or RNA helicase